MRPRVAVLVRGVAATAALLALVAGIPAALVTLVGWPLPSEVPTLVEVTDAITRGHVDTWTVIKMLAVVTWLAWANLTAHIVSEVVAWARGLRTRSMLGPGAFRAVAANLVAAAALLLTSLSRPAVGLEDTGPALAAAALDQSCLPSDDRPGGEPGAGRAHAPHEDRESTAGKASAGGDGPVWVVRPRETLWGIAEQALGDGLRWRDIHRLNVDRLQPDGGALRSGDEHIRPGWRLLLPHDAQLEPTTTVDAAVALSEEAATIAVEPGDTLWGLSEEHLADPFRWPELYEANRDRPQPDGRRLTEPDLIHPGWQLTLPSTTEPGAARATDPTDHALDEVEQDVAGAPEAEATGPPAPHDQRAATPPDAQATERRAEPARSADTGEATETEDEDAVTSPAVLILGIGVAAAGIAATIDRIRRAQLRRRQPGQRIRLPEGDLVATERRIRGFADPGAADLLTRALGSLTGRRDRDRSVERNLVLASTTDTEICVHLNEPDTDAPDGWQVRDDGRTWALPRALAEDLPEPTGPVPGPLVSIGATANRRRRVLLNLRHARLAGIDGPPQARRTVLLGFTVELATSTVIAPWQVVVSGFGKTFANLERIHVADEPTHAVERLERAVRHLGPLPPDGDDGEGTTIALFADPLEEPLLARLREAIESGRGRALAVVPACEALWRLSVNGDVWRLSPPGVELHPLELTAEELDEVGELVRLAKNPGYEPAASEEEVGTPEAVEAGGRDRAATVALAEDREEVEIRVLGPVEITGVERFPTAKSKELTIYLATHKGGADADTLMEALWPGQEPNHGRLQNEASRARKTLGDIGDDTPRLPPAHNNHYRLHGVSVDYDRFRSLVAHAHEHPEHAVTALREALELVRGRPFDATGKEFPWASFRVHAFEQTIADAAHQLAELLLKQGDPEGAAWAARRGLEANPISEALHRDLMRAADAAGNLREIHRIMEDLRRRISEDGAENDADDWLHPETLRLYQEFTHREHRSTSPR